MCGVRVCSRVCVYATKRDTQKIERDKLENVNNMWGRGVLKDTKR